MKYHRLLSGARFVWITDYLTARINYKGYILSVKMRLKEEDENKEGEVKRNLPRRIENYLPGGSKEIDSELQALVFMSCTRSSSPRINETGNCLGVGNRVQAVCQGIWLPFL
jgi:hypothetical protein